MHHWADPPSSRSSKPTRPAQRAQSSAWLTPFLTNPRTPRSWPPTWLTPDAMPSRPGSDAARTHHAVNTGWQGQRVWAGCQTGGRAG